MKANTQRRCGNTFVEERIVKKRKDKHGKKCDGHTNLHVMTQLVLNCENMHKYSLLHFVYQSPPYVTMWDKCSFPYIKATK